MKVSNLGRVGSSCLIGTLGFLLLTSGHTHPGRSLKDQTLTLVIGSNSVQKGSGTYNCTNAQADASNNTQVTSSGCAALTGADIPTSPALTCISCLGGPSTSGKRSDPNGDKIVYQSAVDCSKTNFGASSLWTQGTCIQSVATRKGTCDGLGQNTGKACTATFNEYAVQADTIPIDPIGD